MYALYVVNKGKINFNIDRSTLDKRDLKKGFDYHI